jgi:hypothetical protein
MPENWWTPFRNKRAECSRAPAVRVDEFHRTVSQEKSSASKFQAERGYQKKEGDRSARLNIVLTGKAEYK